ncbi:MAG: hypothetical protein EOO40_02970 [Deltaproteobacteria bacterium]|nr:MAG: hypothetical protein EOO40_02970 [Deltaproteobacteria bacterium]
MKLWKVFGGVLAIVILPAMVRAQSAPAGQVATFDVGNTTLAPGTGDRIINAFAPELRGRGQGPAVEAQLNPLIAQLGAQLQDDVLAKLAALNFGPFVLAMANASAVVTRSMPIDHATRFRLLSLSAGGVVAGNTELIRQVSTVTDQFNNIANGSAPTVGGSADLSVLLGINLAAFHLPQRRFFDPDRMQIFLSGMHLPLGSPTDQYQVNVSHYGLHGKYQLLRARQLTPRFNIVRWGGLNVATGFAYATQDIDVKADLPSGTASSVFTLPNVGTNLTVRYAYQGTGRVGTHTDLYTVPIEVSSSLQLLYFLTLYAGGGVDFAWGNTDLTASASEPTHVTLSGRGTTLDVLDPQPTLRFALTQSPTTVTGRGFFGLQINAGVVALFAQASIDSTSTVGAAAGLRLFY